MFKNPLKYPAASSSSAFGEREATAALTLIEKDGSGEGLTRKERRDLSDARWKSEMCAQQAVDQLIVSAIPWDEFEPKVNELMGSAVFRVLHEDQRNSLGEKLLSKILSYESPLREENDRLIREIALVDQQTAILRASTVEPEKQIPSDLKQMQDELQLASRKISDLKAETACAKRNELLLAGLCKLRGINPEPPPNESANHPPQGAASPRDPKL